MIYGIIIVRNCHRITFKYILNQVGEKMDSLLSSYML